MFPVRQLTVKGRPLAAALHACQATTGQAPEGPCLQLIWGPNISGLQFRGRTPVSATSY